MHRAVDTEQTIQVAKLQNKLRFYRGDKAPWTQFPDSYKCTTANYKFAKEISSGVDRTQPPQLGDVGCFTADRCPDSDMFVVVDYDEPNDMIYAIFRILKIRPSGLSELSDYEEQRVKFYKLVDNEIIPCTETDEFKIYKFPYHRCQQHSTGWWTYHSYLSEDAVSHFYDET